MPTEKPIILNLSGHDPSGGAGISADINVFLQHGCHPCSILTCLTVQDSSSVYRLIPLEANDILQQAQVLFADLPISVIKIGLTGSVACVEAIVQILKLHPDIPVVFDPVLASGDGTQLSNQSLIAALTEQLIPLCSVLTPNTVEACQLAGLASDTSVESVGLALLKLGVEYVLITGGHEVGNTINNRTFHQNQLIQQLSWPRQAGEFHGTGCTLASAIAAQLALGENVCDAIEKAQTYTHNAIKNAYKPGKGQFFLAH